MHSAIYHLHPSYQSVGAGGVGGPGEEVDGDDPLAVEDELLNGRPHGWPVVLGHSLQFGVVDGAVDHLSVPHAGDAPEAVAPLEQVGGKLLHVEAAVELDGVHLDAVAVLGSVARDAVLQALDAQRRLDHELVVARLHEEDGVLQRGVGELDEDALPVLVAGEHARALLVRRCLVHVRQLHQVFNGVRVCLVPARNKLLLHLHQLPLRSREHLPQVLAVLLDRELPVDQRIVEHARIGHSEDYFGIGDERPKVIDPHVGGHSSSGGAADHDPLGLGEVVLVIRPLDVRAGVDCALEVEQPVLVLDRDLVVALVEGAVTVHDHDLGPVGELGLGGVHGEDAAISAVVGVRPHLGGAELALAALVAGLERGGDVIAKTGAAPDEVEQEVLGIAALVQVDHGIAAVQALRLGVGVVDQLVVDASSSGEGEQGAQQEEDLGGSHWT